MASPAIGSGQSVPPSTQPPVLQPEQARVDEAMAMWEEESKKLSPKKAAACRAAVNYLARGIIYHVGNLRNLGYPESHLREITDFGLEMLNRSAADWCVIKENAKQKMAASSKELSDIDEQLSALSLPPHHKHEPEHTGWSLFAEALQGETVHQVEHLAGEPWGTITETVTTALTNKAPEGSSHPIRDRILSASSHVGIIGAAGAVSRGMAAVGAVSRAIPGYQVIVGTHALGKAAQVAEANVHELLEAGTYSPQEMTPGWQCDGICMGPYHQTLVTEKVLQGLQIPSKALHSAHEVLTKASVKTFDVIEEVVQQANVLMEMTEDSTGTLP